MSPPTVRQITHAPHGHILTNVNVWSPDSRRIVYDVRSDVAGGIFDGDRIETVGLATGEVRQLYQSRNRAHCGVVTYHPTQHRVVLILGPEHPTDDFQYGFARRQGVMVDEQHPGLARNLDARDLSSPFTPGALRGGSHVHVFSPDGAAVSFTYEDHVLGAITEETAGREINLRNVGVSLLGAPVTVPPSHPRNHDGEAFTVLVSKTVAHPRPGSDDIKKAYEEGWIVRAGLRSLVFLGDTVDDQGRTVPEIFRVDLPADLASPSRRETAVIEGGCPATTTHALSVRANDRLAPPLAARLAGWIAGGFPACRRATGSAIVAAPDGRRRTPAGQSRARGRSIGVLLESGWPGDRPSGDRLPGPHRCRNGNHPATGR